MPEQTMTHQSDLVDVSDLSLQAIGELGESAVAHALRDALDPDRADAEAVAGFGS
ncbi:FxSxx-COOH cyclophane-containing RiPP peptide [Spirillospora sp. NPDC050679]